MKYYDKSVANINDLLLYFRNFGMVSSELKRDKRTVEQTLNDIQEKKRLKTQMNPEWWNN